MTTAPTSSNVAETTLQTRMPASASIGLLILRVSMGGFMLVHGIPKLLAFSEMSQKFPDPLGMGSQWSLISAIGAEVGCAVLLILGLGTRFAAIPLAFTMAIAAFLVHGDDPWQKQELAAVFLSAYLALVFTGGGTFSLDHRIRRKRSA